MAEAGVSLGNFPLPPLSHIADPSLSGRQNRFYDYGLRDGHGFV